MCSLFEMENSGDLTDVVRAGGGIYGCGGSDSNSDTNPTSNWQFSSQPIDFPSDSGENFGDPFFSKRDPLCHVGESSTSSSRIINTNRLGSFSEGFSEESMILRQRIFRDEIRSPRNIFSHGLQISPTTKLPVPSRYPPLLINSQSSIKHASMASSDMISPTSSNRCLIDNSSIQVSSPRNSGTKRRKSQAKKVVCIPAPAPANSRSTGEVVPSDLWAWRKYGQKPIKGSPYPRGYYRCSSSKGCSARKQVERSRTDPKMLVITYTSEHNHPWPTMRNALAGSTRSQPSRKSDSGASLKPSNGCQGQEMTIQEEEEEEEEEEMKEKGVSSGLYVKEETEEIDQIKGLEMDNEDQFDEAFAGCTSDDFFADMGEIQTDDSLNIIFSEAFSGNKPRDGKNLDYPFSQFD